MLTIDEERRRFTYRGARSSSLVIGIGLVLAVETAVLHAWLHARHPAAACSLIVLSVVTIAWLAADYYFLGRGAIVIAGRTLFLDVGLRVRTPIAVDAVVNTIRPAWRELPAQGSPDAADYRDLTKPAPPNVLLSLRYPMEMRVGGVRRTVRRIGLHLDEPDAFVAVVNDALAAAPMVGR